MLAGACGDPYQLDFESDHGGVPDGRGTGTGFTYLAPPSSGTGFEPSRLLVSDGFLSISTGPGINYLNTNTLANALAVGVPAAARVFSVWMTIGAPPRGVGSWEQGGLWLGIDQDNYIKLVTISYRGRSGIQLLGEADGPAATGARFARRFVAVSDLDRRRVTLVLRADAEEGTVAGFYAVDGGALKHVATFLPPRALLTGGGRADPVLAGGRLVGMFASHRSGPGPLVYRFESFDVACHNEGCPTSRPDPGPGEPGKNVVERDAPAHGSPGFDTISGTSGRLRVELRHPRRVRASRLASRGLPVVLRCSEGCAMRARLRGPRRRGSLARTSWVAVGEAVRERPPPELLGRD